MTALPPQLKHHILTSYQPNSRGYGFQALAQTYNIKGGGRTVQRWYDKWDGTPASLEDERGAGRPTLLSPAEITQYISTPIRLKNRKHDPVHYTQLRQTVEEKTGKKISIRTIRRYGKEKLNARNKRTQKRTQQESPFAQHRERAAELLLRVCTRLTNFGYCISLFV
jgi:transposase